MSQIADLDAWLRGDGRADAPAARAPGGKRVVGSVCHDDLRRFILGCAGIALDAPCVEVVQAALAPTDDGPGTGLHFEIAIAGAPA